MNTENDDKNERFSIYSTSKKRTNDTTRESEMFVRATRRERDAMDICACYLLALSGETRILCWCAAV